MQYFPDVLEKFSMLESDADVALALKEYFSELGVVNSANRFPVRGESGKRCYVVLFKNSLTAIKAANKFKLNPYAYNGVLVKLDSPPDE